MGVAALHHHEAERALLAAVLLDPGLAESFSRELRADDFTDSRHQAILRAVRRVHTSGMTFDLRTAQAHLEARGELEAAGGIAYLAGLDVDLPDLTRVDEYRRLVRDASVRRGLVTACQTAVHRTEAGATFEEVIGAHTAALRELEEDSTVDELLPIGDCFGTILDRLENPIAPGDAGIPSGFSDLDRLTLGWSPGQLVIVAARPGIGKTALGCGFARVAADCGVPSIFVSLEMSHEELAMRFVSAETNVALSRLRTGHMTRDEGARVREALDRLKTLPLVLDEPASLTPSRLSAILRKAKRERGIKLAVVDYLGLMRPDDGSKLENQNLRVAEISRSLKVLARELQITLIALHQLNRSSEKREDRRPMMSDLRDSGAVEQDADMILLIYREPPAGPDDKTSEAELILAKQRNGPTDTVKVRQRLDVFRFDPIPKGWV